MQPHILLFRAKLLAVFTLTVVLTSAVAQAQAPGVTNQPLGFGQAPYADAVDGPADIALARVTLDPGRGSGWHSHPGPGWVIVTIGTLSLYRLDGCQTVYPAGTAFREEPGEVHDARNNTTEPVEFLVSFTVPAGAPLLSLETANPDECR